MDHQHNAQPAPGGRFESLDILRGLAVAGMTLVISPGTWDHRYAPLLHADWIGWPAADFIFPAFLFAVGVSVALSIGKRLQQGANFQSISLSVLRRAALLMVLGLMVQLVPDFSLSSLRLPGVLQRIGLCYALAAFFFLGCWTATKARPDRLAIAVTVMGFGLLVLYHGLLYLAPEPGIGAGSLDSYSSVAAWLDRQVFGIAHLWPYGTTEGRGVTFDPEGLLSTLPATANVLFGVAAGIALKHIPQRTTGLYLIAGILLIILAFALSTTLPIIKKIWTASFALLSSGVSLLIFATLRKLFDDRKPARVSYPFRVLGSNATVSFVIIMLAGPIFDLPLFGGQSLRTVGFQALHSFIDAPKLASFGFAAVTLAVLVVAMSVLYQRRIFVRI